MRNIGRFFGNLLRSKSDIRLDSYKERVAAINSLDSELHKLTDSELASKTSFFKEQFANGAPIASLLIPAFATVRETAKRVLGQRHYDVQLVGGMVLNDGCIAEMLTGEGKTLVSTLPTYLNALAGKHTHIVTVNDYLAKRDAQWMSAIYNFLGIKVGTIVNGLNDVERRESYSCDVTYGTNNELGFDYLRDNMKHGLEHTVQGSHDFVILDEVDSILIDEARTPLIISGQCESSTEIYKLLNPFGSKLNPKEEFELDEKQRSVSFTEKGIDILERDLGNLGLLKSPNLYDAENVSIVHHLEQALKAHLFFKKNRDYIVKNGEVILVDEFTGRLATGRRYSDGLHQALEAKERVVIQPENQTLASITFQNYFCMYKKLSGMTGTAMTEAKEFLDIYGLEVVKIPPNVPVTRRDEEDSVYRTEREKYQAIIQLIEECKSRNQPILVGTTSIAKSEKIAAMLSKRGWSQIDLTDSEQIHALREKNQNDKIFSVLNARYHEQEAEIVAQAGIPGGVTIATNMAGRGTDIQLGGNATAHLNKVIETIEGKQQLEQIEKIKSNVASLKNIAIQAGGLYVLGTERHESRRIDNQLRGRSGRQGDPGTSKFFLSLQDDLMRIFGSDSMDKILQRLGLREGEPIVHRFVSKALEQAQKKVEERNFSIRKSLLSFDNVVSDQRKIIFKERKDIMAGEATDEICRSMIKDAILDVVDEHVDETETFENLELTKLNKVVDELFDSHIELKLPTDGTITKPNLINTIIGNANNVMDKTLHKFGIEVLQHIEKAILLQTIDTVWREHLTRLEHLREVIGLRGYGQRDPLQEYRIECFHLFDKMLKQVRFLTTKQILSAHITVESPDVLTLNDTQSNEITAERHPTSHDISANVTTSTQDLPRNAKCHCGSGKKYKHCHGKRKF